MAVEAFATWGELAGDAEEEAGILTDPRITPNPINTAKPTIVLTNDLRE